MFKYLVYCGLASILGSAAGLFTGLRLLPSVLWTAYASMYHLPDFVTQFSFTYALFSAVPVVLSTMIATYAACRQVMKENPSTLMLPKAPKAGKRVFLERVRFLWSHMTFSQKATARNLLRYKKHFFMTVTGIAGCTALIVTGFGLRDSLGSITETQYNEIYHYDLMIGLKEITQADAQLNGFLQNKERVESWAGLFSSTGNVFYNNEIYTTTVYAPENAEEFTKMIQLRDRKSGSAIPFSHSSVIMTEKLAEVAGIDTGDTFTLENKDGDTAEFVLEGTTENYTGSFVYIGKDAYSRAFENNFSRNALMVKTTISDASGQDSALTEILTFNAVSNASFISQTKTSFDNLLSSIDFIVIVLILAAGALAVIVLYNLTNININERRKELATLKVLGFHPEEVAGYIFRETTLLSIIGTLAGLLLGVLLHAFVIQTAESAEFMFGRSISPLSFLLSAAVTLFFSFVVDLLMYKKLKNIEMVDSMKAID